MANIRSITPNDPANFTPVLGNYKTLQPFRYWCQKVLPLVYDDSLSYYELLCKVVDYLNKTMEDVETLHGDVTKLHTAYEELQSYVNNYFSTLDVQEEINNKLDLMASDGTLTNLINPLIAPAVSEWLKNNLTPTAPPIDKTLTIEGACADAKITGDVIKYYTGITPFTFKATEEQQYNFHLVPNILPVGSNFTLYIDSITGSASIINFVGQPTNSTGVPLLTNIDVGSYHVTLNSEYESFGFWSDSNDTVITARIISPITDKSLTLNNVSADAKITGDVIKYYTGITPFTFKATEEQQYNFHLVPNILPVGSNFTLYIDSITGSASIINFVGQPTNSTGVPLLTNIDVGSYHVTLNSEYESFGFWSDSNDTVITARIISPITDKSLTLNNVSADAKITGDVIKYYNGCVPVKYSSTDTDNYNFTIIRNIMPRGTILTIYCESVSNSGVNFVGQVIGHPGVALITNLESGKYYTITLDADYTSFGYFTSSPSSVSCRIYTNYKKELKVLTMGDSITELGVSNRGWIKYFMENSKFAVKLIHNTAVIGAWLHDSIDTIYDGNPSQDKQVNNTLGNQVQNIINNKYEEPDIIIIAIGINSGVNITQNDIKNTYYDESGNKKPLNNVDKTTDSGAFRYANEKLTELYPNAKIFWSSPIQSARSVHSQEDVEKYDNSYTIACHFIGSEPIHSNTCGINGFYEKWQEDGKYLIDGLHPNVNGAKTLGKYISSEINKLVF